MTKYYIPPATPEPTSIDWPRLMAKAEARGIPVLRIDQHGAPWILRSVADLDGWED